MLQASLIVKLVLLILFIFSLVSWAIIVTKWRELRGASEDSEAFLEVYHEEPFNSAYDAAKDLDRSPLALVFLATCDEMARLVKQANRSSVHELDAAGMRLVGKYLTWVSGREAQDLERGLSFLATTGSSAVYIGLFGTVIGIIQAFQGIARSGNASLAVVAPGIAEALIATAVGLVAAIPATIFYNHYSAKVDAIVASMRRFDAQLRDDLDHLVQPQQSPPSQAPPGSGPARG